MEEGSMPASNTFMPKRTWRAALQFAALSVFSLLASGPPAVAEGLRIAAAVAPFDNQDTSGEDPGRISQHAARVDTFANLLGDNLAAQGRYQIVPLGCAGAQCSPATLPP